MAEHVCARCPRALGTSCCEVTDEQQLATLTLADVDRIAFALRRSAKSFCETEWLSEEEARVYEERRPLYRNYFRHGPQRLTLRRRAGACVFLDRGSGCTLSTSQRPTACLLYPFELWPSGQWSLQVDRHGSVNAARAWPGSACLAVEESQSMEDVLGAFSLAREDVESLGQRLLSEVAHHARHSASPSP